MIESRFTLNNNNRKLRITVDTLITHTPRSLLLGMGYERVWDSRGSPKMGPKIHEKII